MMQKYEQFVEENKKKRFVLFPIQHTWHSAIYKKLKQGFLAAERSLGTKTLQTGKL